MSYCIRGFIVMLLVGLHHVQAEEPAARLDPFQPLNAARCLPSIALPPWQLKGVIGSDDRWTGWLAQADAGWVRFTRGEIIPPGHWLVSELNQSGATLVPTAHETGCDGLPDSLLLASPFLNQPVKE